jgi:hypothetical protein
VDVVEDRGVKSVVEDMAVEVKRGNHSLDRSALLDSRDRGSDGSGLPKFASNHKLLPAPWFVNETHDWALEGDAARIHTHEHSFIPTQARRPTHTHTHAHAHTHTHSLQRVDASLRRVRLRATDCGDCMMVCMMV